MENFIYTDTDSVKIDKKKPLSREAKLLINRAVVQLKLLCDSYEDCVDDCPFVEYTQNRIPHCKLDCKPENWELIK